ncbi:TniQ family protein [Caballeronia cordobensis]|uniref:TniQ family protein n=1 Tax=Caballeronia cordobensis TaxID=1353886 RepID=UPI000A006D13
MCPTNLIPLTRYIATRFRSFLIALRKSPCIRGWFCAISVLSLRFDGIKRIRSCPSCKPRKRKMAQMWVDSLNGMVGRNDLRLLTLLPWKPYLGRFSRLTGEGRQWCPLCLEEDLQSRTPVYERLIWLMRWVGHCPRHRCRLAERCPECGYQQAGELSPLQSCGF